MYKPLQSVDWYHLESSRNTSQSTTHEMLETGIANRSVYNKSNKKRFNFIDFRIDKMKIDKPDKIPLVTSYNRDYAALYATVCPQVSVDENVPDRLWNRIPLNDFATERLTASEFKFMDDHLVNLTAERRRVNFFRQIRNHHFPLA